VSDCDVTYDVAYRIRGQESSVLRRSIAQVEWDRRYDEISECTVEHVITDPDCCVNLNRLEPWADTVSIYEDGELVWSGWITAVEYGFDTVTVTAADALVWSRYRALSESYSATRDSAEHFGALWENAMARSPLPIEVRTYATGVRETREYDIETKRRTLWFLIKDMLESSVDVVVLGNTIHAGQLSLGSPIDLKRKDFSGDVILRKDGLLYANEVLVEARGGEQATYPTDSPSGYSVYPLVQDIIFDEEIESPAAAAAMARSRWDYSSGIVPRLLVADNTLTLRDDAVPIQRLIPGTIVNVEELSMCFSEQQQMKLGRVSVQYAQGRRSVAIALEPVGTFAKLDEISADDDSGGD
jgi:hypothetical protein